jgi:hypothetical protein
MNGERMLLRIGECLVGHACLRLPSDIRDERYQEWAAELPAILHDPEIRLAPRRALRMLCYAADTLRAAMVTPGRATRRPTALSALLVALTIAGSLSVAWSLWDTVRAPGQWVSYVHVAWAMLVTAWPASLLVRSSARTTGLILTSATLAGLLITIWNAAQAPGDWVDYSLPAVLFLMLMVWFLVRRWVRSGGGSAMRPGKVPAP